MAGAPGGVADVRLLPRGRRVPPSRASDGGAPSPPLDGFLSTPVR
jgi:hypothetical protein